MTDRWSKFKALVQPDSDIYVCESDGTAGTVKDYVIPASQARAEGNTPPTSAKAPKNKHS